MKKTVFEGEEKLRAGAGQIYPPMVRKVADNVYAFLYFGVANATLVVGENECILIDCFETDAYAEMAKKEIEKITDKPVTAIFYTHTHGDHNGGAQAFEATVKNIYQHTSFSAVLARQDQIGKVFTFRLLHQMGAALTPEESISMGLGPITPPNGKVASLPPTDMVDADIFEVTIGGVEFRCIAAAGETDDTMFVYLPQQNIVCCGDDYYASWPNLAALRGSQYRDIDQWVQSLGKLRDLKADILIPGHGEVLGDAETVFTTISNYHDAIDYVLTETLKGMNEGLTPDQMVEQIRLPEQWAKLPYLQPYYGCVEWAIRGIFAGYLGFFDGNPTHIGTMAAKEKADRMLELIGGADKVCASIQTAMEKETVDDMQWVMEMCDVLLNAGLYVTEAKAWKAEACIFLGRSQVSANGRHYYLMCAKDLQA